MKKITYLLSFIAIVFAACQNQTEKATTVEKQFYVRGECEQCKERIEKAAKDVNGVSSADWNVDTEVITVKFDSTKTDQIDIEEAIAAAGHGTQHVQMNQEAYEKLPECCKIKEEEEEKTE